MGYSGSIYFNESQLFFEKKGCGDFCQIYAEAYNKQKSVILSIEDIDCTFRNFHDAIGSYNDTLCSINAANNIISALSELLSYDNDPFFNEEGKFLLVPKMQNGDVEGNSVFIYFYKENAVSDVPEVKLHERIYITEEQLMDIRIKRRVEIKTINVARLFNGFDKSFPDKTKNYHKMVEEIYNIKKIDDVFVLLEKVNKYQTMLNEKYKKEYELAINISKTLAKCKEKILNGEVVRAIYKDGFLYFYTNKEYAKFKIYNFFTISDLYSSVGTHSYGSCAKIDTLQDFEKFVFSFKTIDSKHRNYHIENLLEEKLIEIRKTPNKKFSLTIGGSY